MKKLLLITALFASLQTFAQVPDMFTFSPYTVCRFHSSDSIQVNFQVSTNNIVNARIDTIFQTAGPLVKFTPAPSWVSGTTINKGFWLQGLAPGIYSFTATGRSGSGTNGTQVETFTVIADPVCPVCPPIPSARVATSITLSIYGVPVTIPLPATGVSIKYNDGSTQ